MFRTRRSDGYSAKMSRWCWPARFGRECCCRARRCAKSPLRPPRRCALCSLGRATRQSTRSHGVCVCVCVRLSLSLSLSAFYRDGTLPARVPPEESGGGGVLCFGAHPMACSASTPAGRRDPSAWPRGHDDHVAGEVVRPHSERIFNGGSHRRGAHGMPTS